MVADGINQYERSSLKRETISGFITIWMMSCDLNLEPVSSKCHWQLSVLQG